MNRTDFDAMGDRQKAFEATEAQRRLPAGSPVLVRLDGRAFHSFTRGLERPFDARFSRCMVETARFLVHETHAAIAYTQSDEISLAFLNSQDSEFPLFGGRVQKLCSVLASLATAKFNQVVALELPQKTHLLPVFDARVYCVPDLQAAHETFLWREADAQRNSLTMAANASYSPKQLHLVGAAGQREMLRAKGVEWADYPANFKRGTFLRRETSVRHLSEAELARIPEAHRPSEPVLRSSVVVLEMPPLAQVGNALDVLFRGASPQPAPSCDAQAAADKHVA